MSEKKHFVQHISGQGAVWEVTSETSVRFRVKAPDAYLSGLDLPKSEFKFVEAPKLWRNVTSECDFVKGDGFERDGIKHFGPSNAVCLFFQGYRMRKMIASELLNTRDFVFLIEKEEEQT